MVRENVPFPEELKKRQDRVNEFLLSSEYEGWFRPVHLREAIVSYLHRGGKRLRPILCLLSCGVLGGDESSALPAAAAMEVFHTWTLVHDDIIDKDTLRRGGETVHEEFRRRAIEELGYPPERAGEYGRNIAILAGDVQHGWAVSLLSESSSKRGVHPEVTLSLIRMMELEIVSQLICGEALDVQLSGKVLEKSSIEEIEEMLSLKTASLLEFCARAGGLIGLNSFQREDPRIASVAGFARGCGIAFQLQDDVLGITGDEKRLGKPVGSDIREGKRTPIIYCALQRAGTRERRILEETLGDPRASPSAIRRVREILVSLGCIEEVQKRADRILEEALSKLAPLKESPCKELLKEWARYISLRDR